MTTRSMTSFIGQFMPFKKKRLYLQSRESFYEGRNYLTSYSRISSFVHNSSANSLATDKPIKFYGLDFGISLKRAISHLGKPNYAGKGSHLLRKHRVIYYRISITGVKCILQLHFLQDQFFLGLIELRTSEKSLRQEVTRLVKMKYGSEDQAGSGLIKDDRGNHIELKDDIVPYIVYCSGDREIRATIAMQLEQWQAKRRKFYDKQSDLLLEMI